MSPGETRLSVPDAPRTRTSAVVGTSPSNSRPAGKLLQLERYAQAAFHGLLAGDDHPQQHRNRHGQQLQADVAERPDGAHGQMRPAISGVRTSRLGAEGAPLENERLQADAQRVGVESTLDLTVDDDRDEAGFLRDDNRHRVVLFGEPDGRAMTGAELLAQLRIDRQRQEARRRRNAIGLHDHGAVVQRRRGLKDAHEQIVGQHGVERNPALDVIAQSDLPLDRDDGADPLGGQQPRGDDQLLDRFLGRFRLREVAEERRAAEMRERPADIGLKQHDDGEDDVPDEIANQKVDGLEVAPAREVEQARGSPRRRGPSERRASRGSA